MTLKDSSQAIKVLAKAFRRRRLGLGMKKVQVARAAGISDKQYMQMEKGEAVNPTIESILSVCRALDLDCDLTISERPTSSKRRS
jgi:transcriptional regulator with XRE-family HTH domain